MKRYVPFLLFVLAFCLTAAAETVIDQFRIGDEWGKIPLTAEQLGTANAELLRLVKTTGKFSTPSTVHYLGRFNERHLISTAAHVLRNELISSDGSANLAPVFLGHPTQKMFFCTNEVLGIWDEIDFAVAEIGPCPHSQPQYQELQANRLKTLQPLGRNYDFRGPPIAEGEHLLNLGYGTIGNPDGQMVLNQDEDCRVISPTGVYRVNQRSKGNAYQPKTIAIGCDASPGDSGSAVIERRSGRLVASLVSGSPKNKNKEVQSSASLNKLIGKDTPIVWNDLTYAVPAIEIHSVVSRWISTQARDAKNSHKLDALIALLDNRADPLE